MREILAADDNGGVNWGKLRRKADADQVREACMGFRITALPARACRISASSVEPYSGTREATNNRASETSSKSVAAAID